MKNILFGVARTLVSTCFDDISRHQFASLITTQRNCELRSLLLESNNEGKNGIQGHCCNNVILGHCCEPKMIAFPTAVTMCLNNLFPLLRNNVSTIISAPTVTICSSNDSSARGLKSSYEKMRQSDMGGLIRCSSLTYVCETPPKNEKCRRLPLLNRRSFHETTYYLALY